MKKINIFIIIFLIIFITSCSNEKNSNELLHKRYKFPKEFESNNDFDDATRIINQTYIYGQLTKDDIDYYKYENTSSENLPIKIKLMGTDISELNYEIYDSNKNFLTNKSDLNNGLIKIRPNSFIYLKISSYNDNIDRFGYNLYFEQVLRNNLLAELEPNNTEETASILQFNKPIKGKCFRTDTDIYKITIEKPSFYSLNINVTSGIIDCKIVQNSLTQFEMHDIKGISSLTPVFFVPGDYYFIINSNRGYYNISITEAIWEGEVEFNDSFEFANELVNKDVFNANISWNNDIDYYLYKSYGKQEIEIQINNSGNNVLKVYIIDNDKKITKETKAKPGKSIIKLDDITDMIYLKVIPEKFEIVIPYKISIKQ